MLHQCFQCFNLNPVISVISVVLGEITLTISDSIETSSPVETEIVRVISPSGFH